MPMVYLQKKMSNFILIMRQYQTPVEEKSMKQLAVIFKNIEIMKHRKTRESTEPRQVT